jgi:hypothetical protein
MVLFTEVRLKRLSSNVNVRICTRYKYSEVRPTNSVWYANDSGPLTKTEANIVDFALMSVQASTSSGVIDDILVQYKSILSKEAFT